MADTVDESAFWLPSEFLTGNDFFLTANHRPQSALHHVPPPNNGGFPLFRRSSSALNSPGESVESSTETESSDDPDEFIAELTRHLAQSALRERASKPYHHPQSQEKSWGALATSPQSTLTGFTGWTNRCPGGTRTPPSAPPLARSPPAFEPSQEEAWELIYAAAERVAKMRMNSQAQMLNHQQSIRRGLLRASSHMACSSPVEVCTPPVRYIAPQDQFQQMKIQAKQAWLSQHQVPNRGANATVHGLPQSSSFPPLRAQQQSNHHQSHACTGGGGSAIGPGMRAVFLGGSGSTGVKRQSTGTGVFLPRRIGNYAPTEPRKKQGCSTVLLPARVVQALNLDIDEMNGHTNPHTHTQTQPCLSAFNHEILMARRNAVLAQQQRRGSRVEGPMSHHEVPLLPQEWTY